MMKLIFLGVVALGLVSMVTSLQCCLPTKFSLTEEFLVGSSYRGKGYLTEGIAWSSLDADRRIAGMFLIGRVNDKRFEEKYIKNYETRTGYIIVGRSCKKIKLRPWRGTCLSNPTRDLGETYYGVGRNSLKVSKYEWDVNNIKVYMAATRTDRDCILVGETAVGATRKGVAFTSSSDFVNTNRTASPRLFVIPRICDDASFLEETDGHTLEYSEESAFMSHRRMFDLF